MAVETTVIIDFGSADADATHVTFELDEALNGDGNFTPGENVYMLVQVSDNAVITDIKATDGSISSQGSVSRGNAEELDFTSRDPVEPSAHTLPHISPRGFSTKYYGRSGAITHTQNTNKTMTLTGDPNTAPYKAEVSYSFTALLFRLATPKVVLGTNESYPITIVLYLDDNTGGSDGCDSL